MYKALMMTVKDIAINSFKGLMTLKETMHSMEKMKEIWQMIAIMESTERISS